MSIQFKIPFPIGEAEGITRTAAMSLVGQSVPCKNEEGALIGYGTVLEVTYNSATDVDLVVEVNNE